MLMIGKLGLGSCCPAHPGCAGKDNLVQLEPLECT